MDSVPLDPSPFIHVRMVLSMVVSLAIARLLAGAARFAQHPGRLRTYWVHLLWGFFLLILLIHFWWWEFALNKVPAWHFATFAFVVGYAAILYLLCVILFPDDIAEYDGYRAYFYSRRKWFFGVLALVFALDLVDTSLKGDAYLIAQGTEYRVRAITAIALCGIAAFVEDARFHAVLVIGAILYQVSWIMRLYDVLA